MITLERYLQKYYFTPGHPIFMSNPGKLYDLVKKKGFDVTLDYLKQWTNNQEAYSLYKGARKKIQRNRIVVAGPAELYDCDLADMSDLAEKNDNYKYILVVIDVFSRKLACRSLKSKGGKEVTDAVRDVFESDLPKPVTLRTDNGTEFKNTVLKKYLSANNVYHQFTYNEPKANYSERVIGTLKRMIYRFITHKNTHRYIDTLQDLVKTYNETVHSATGYKPSNVTAEVGKKLFWKMYKPKASLKHKQYKYRVGDTVRLSYLTNKFARGFDMRWSGELFHIDKRYRRNGLPVYKLKDFHGESLSGTFYTEELTKVDVDPNKIWKVEKVIKTRKRKGKTQYFVKWTLWPDSFNEWVTDVQSS